LGRFNGGSSIEEANRASNHAREVRKVTAGTVSDMPDTSAEILTKTSESENEIEIDITETEGFDGNWFQCINGEWFEWHN
jgi:hypothetical protein